MRVAVVLSLLLLSGCSAIGEAFRGLPWQGDQVIPVGLQCVDTSELGVCVSAVVQALAPLLSEGEWTFSERRMRVHGEDRIALVNAAVMDLEERDPRMRHIEVKGPAGSVTSVEYHGRVPGSWRGLEGDIAVWCSRKPGRCWGPQ